ncbi:MAG: VWA domain-containing protein, partial [Marinicaulis sp.]|nr:VWA domain-containing protein [Marinicaulis sp.]
NTTVAIQEALDAAALAAARNIEKSAAERMAIAQQMFAANLASSSIDVAATPVFEIDDHGVVATVVYNMPTSILKAVNVPDLPIGLMSEAVSPGLGEAEFVFVLDYSSSMDGKYDEMRDAAIDLVDIISEDGTNTSLKFGFVPFAREVYATLDGAYVIGGTPGVSWSNCTRDRRHNYNITDDTPIAGVIDSKWGRTDGDDVIDPDEYDTCGQYPSNNLEIADLDTHAAAINKLNAMTPHEGTNIAVGVEFGYHVLSPNPPWTTAKPYDDAKKFMLILSDGRHNKDGFGPGNSDNEAQARKNMQDNCDAMKARGVKIITVAYDLDDDEGKAELESCATSSQYYLEGDEYDIAEQFQNMGGALLAEVAYLKR